MAEPVEIAIRVPLPDVARVFLRLGIVSFGGPAAHVALMEEEIVRRRRWLTHESFLDLLGAASLIPGPNSTELAIHVGYARAGWPGLLVAGICFIVPAAVIVAVLAWGYLRYGSLPTIMGILAGVKPVVIAIVAQAIWKLGRGVLTSRVALTLGIACVAAAALGVHELLLLAMAGAAMWAIATWRRSSEEERPTSARMAAIPALWAFAAAPAAFTFGGLLLVFLKIGSVLDGVNVASLALMIVVTLQLARSALVGPAGIGLALASGVALMRFRVSAAWLVLAGALLGLAFAR